MNIEGRIRLFTEKFGLRNDSLQFADLIKTLFRDALTSVENDDFSREAAAVIDGCGWTPLD